MSRLTIDITDQQHQNLKAMAARQGKTIKQYALERVVFRQCERVTSVSGAKKPFCLNAPSLDSRMMYRGGSVSGRDHTLYR